MARFFTSDQHFGDDRFNLFYRPFKTIKEQDDYMVDRWNSVVGKNDEVFHLGDFSTTDSGLDISKRLNGKIHLIMGNYDDPRPVNKLNKLFASVKENDEIKLSNGKVVFLNHYPNKAKKSMFNLVGHIHGLWKIQRNMINVSCDAWHFNPVSEDEIIFAMNAIEKFYDDNVFAGELKSNLNSIKGKEIYAGDEIPNYGKKVFLAGPTPRRIDVDSWRPDMIKILRDSGYDGHILIPEKRTREEGYDYDNQVDWETEGLESSDVILFWIPRNLDTMPGFTTNVEFGQWMNSGKIVLGYPDKAEGMRYISKKAKEYKIPEFSSMQELAEYIS